MSRSGSRRVFIELGSTGPGDAVDGPVGEHLNPVEVVAKLLEVDEPPDDLPHDPAELHAQDVGQGARASQIDELTQRSVAETCESVTPNLRRKVVTRDLAFLLRRLCQRRQALSTFDADAVAHSVDPGPVLNAQIHVHEDVSTSVLRYIQGLHQGSGLHAGRPHCGASRDGASVGEHHSIGADLRNLGVVDDLYPLGGEPVDGGVSQRGVDVFEDAVPGVYEHQAHTVEIHLGVIRLEHIMDEVVGTSGTFHPRWSSANEDEGEQPIVVIAPRPLGFFEAVDYGVADLQGLPQPLKVYRVLLDAFGIEESRAAPRGKDEVVVGKAALVRQHFPSLEVHTFDVRLIEIHPQGRDDAPDRVGQVTYLYVR